MLITTENIAAKYAEDFADVGAYVIALNGKLAGQLAFKHCRHHGLVRCYLKLLNEPMVRGIAIPRAHDGQSSAMLDAVLKLKGAATGTEKVDNHAHALHWLFVTNRGAVETNWKTIMFAGGYTVWKAI